MSSRRPVKPASVTFCHEQVPEGRVAMGTGRGLILIWKWYLYREGYRDAKSRIATGVLYRPTVLHSTGCIRYGLSCRGSPACLPATTYLQQHHCSAVGFQESGAAIELATDWTDVTALEIHKMIMRMFSMLSSRLARFCSHTCCVQTGNLEQSC